eukprot:gene14236-3531_t
MVPPRQRRIGKLCQRTRNTTQGPAGCSSSDDELVLWQSFEGTLCKDSVRVTRENGNSPQLRTEGNDIVLAVPSDNHVIVKIGADTSVNLDEIADSAAADCAAQVEAVNQVLTGSVEKTAADVVELREELESSVNTKLEAVTAQLDTVAGTVKSDLEPKIAATEECCAANTQALGANAAADALLKTLVNTMKTTLDANVKTITDLKATNAALQKRQEATEKCLADGLAYDETAKKCKAFTIPIKDGKSQATAAISCSTLHKELGSITGLRWVNPDGKKAFQAYCNNGWSLMMTIGGNGKFRHVKSNAEYKAPPQPNSGEARFSTPDINRFIKAPGAQVFKVDPGPSGGMNWYQRAGSDSEEWPTNLECNNRGTLKSNEKWRWILKSWPNYGNARAGNGGDVGTYSSGGHWYPTPYGPEQLFFATYAGGLRINRAWGSSCCWEGQPGTLWVTDSNN